MLTIDVLLYLVMTIAIVYGQKCGQTNAEADECAARLEFYGTHDVIIPANEQELDLHCRQMKDSIKCLRKYTQSCLPPSPRQAMAILTHNFKRVTNIRCRKSDSRQQFLELCKCLSPKERMLKTNICVRKHIIQLEHIDKRVDPELQIPAICCTFQQRVTCIEKELSDICDRNNVDYAMRLVDDYTHELTDWACGKYVSTDACDQHFDKDIWSSLKDIVDISDEKVMAKQVKHRSSLATIIAIVTQFEM